MSTKFEKKGFTKALAPLFSTNLVKIKQFVTHFNSQFNIRRLWENFNYEAQCSETTWTLQSVHPRLESCSNIFRYSTLILQVSYSGPHLCIWKGQTILPTSLDHSEDITGEIPSIVLTTCNLCDNLFSLYFIHIDETISYQDHTTYSYVIGRSSTCIF